MDDETKDHARRALERAVSLIGGKTDASRALGVSRRTIYDWLDRGWPSPEAAAKIEEITHKAITRLDLRPDLYQ